MAAMKAIGASQFLAVSDPRCLIEFEIEKPLPSPKDLVVKIQAVAVNPVDTKIRALLGAGPHDPPRILGWDAAGIVESIGAEVSGFSPGDEVFYAGDLSRAGCNADFQAVDARLVAKKPKSWSFVDAAAVPLAGITAWELLFERMHIDLRGAHQGKTLLVINGAGGVGSAAIPLAKSAGLKVVATASRPETIEWCTSLGADHVINHHEPLRPQIEALGLKHVDYIANFHNTEAYWETMSDLIAPLGSLGLIVEPREKLHIGDPLKAKCACIAWEFMGSRSRFQTPDMHRQGEILAEIANRCDSGNFPKITTRVFDSLTLENLRKAHAALESGKVHGKWVLTHHR
jgi:NADPH:quinone reductase